MTQVNRPNIPIAFSGEEWRFINRAVIDICQLRDQSWIEWQRMITQAIVDSLNQAANDGNQVEIYQSFPADCWAAIQGILTEKLNGHDQNWSVWQTSLGSRIQSAILVPVSSQVTAGQKQQAVQRAIDSIYHQGLGPIPYQNRVIQSIYEYLGMNELPEAVIFARHPLVVGGCGGLWATNQRLLYVGLDMGEMLLRSEPVVEYYPYAIITYVDAAAQSADRTHHFTVYTACTSFCYTQIYQHARISHFSDLVRSKIYGGSDTLYEQLKISFERVDLVYQLSRLSRLKDLGYLTEKEFQAAKAKLLG